MFSAASLLFVPGSRPDRFAKAKASGAGLTVIDLEDAVAAEDKVSARKAALDHVEGSETLPFQIANAARAAVTASDLAGAGFSAPKDPLEGLFGYYQLFEAGELERYTSQLGSIWRISEVSTKPYPSGRASHAGH